MELFEALKNRRSIRRFANKEVPEEDVQRILEAAAWAPSAHNTQPWNFIIVRDKNKLEQLAIKSKYAKFLSQSPMAIIVCAQFDQGRQRDEERYLEYYCIQDTAAAIQNMLLAAHGLGLATCWIGDFREDEMRGVYQIPDGHNVVAIVALGYKEDGISPAMPSREKLDEKIHREKW